MENNQITIPEGWTYFVHRTNSSKWQNNPLNEQSIILNRLMSVITERDAYQEVRHYGAKYIQGYSNGEGMPFEIRCLICNLEYLNSMDDSDIKKIMYNEFYYDKRNFGGCYGQRHPSIPKGEELVVIGIGEYDEVYGRPKNIIWTIPKRFIEFYKMEVEKKNNRIISLELPQAEQTKKI